MSRSTARPMPELVVVTGMSGAGRSTAADALEDLGWYVVDNLPPALLPDAGRARGPASQGTVPRIAVGRRLRGRAFFNDLAHGAGDAARPAGSRRDVAVPRGLRRGARPPLRASRRPHPLQGDGRVARRHRRASASCSRDLRGDADLVIDTSALNVHELRAAGRRRRSRRRATRRCGRRVVSFGFKYGMPVDADLVAGRAVPAQPALDPRAAPADRPRPRGERLRARPAGRRRVPRPLRRAARD